MNTTQRPRMGLWTPEQWKQIKQIESVLCKLYDSPADQIAWFYSPQATLLGNIPANLVRSGDADVVLNAIQAAVDGNHI